MNILIDAHIPFLQDAILRSWPEVHLCALEPAQIDARSVRDADALVVRTRTRVDAALLSGSCVRLVCTATIGYDHIDTAYCAAHGIRWISCPGCNAQAVCDYIAEVLEESVAHLSPSQPPHSPYTIGIVGVGHVGSRVARMAATKGMSVLLCDPPKGIGISLSRIAQESDIITFHTPLTFSGDYPTYHLCDTAFLALTRPDALIINAARGGVVDEQALLASGRRFVLDTWENEPVIDRRVLSAASLATMHIAGYSVTGKKNASQTCLDALSSAFALPPISLADTCLSEPPGDTAPGWVNRISVRLKSAPEQFENLRKSYPLRGE